jgi:hypothetical protein
MKSCDDLPRIMRLSLAALVVSGWLLSCENGARKSVAQQTSHSIQPVSGSAIAISPLHPVTESVYEETVEIDDDLPTEPIAVAPQDEIWMIDGRNCHCNPQDLSLLNIFRLDGCTWSNQPLDALYKAHDLDRSKTTFIYVHGDRTDSFYATFRGMTNYRNVFGEGSERCCQGVRFVIWSWKSEKEFHRPSKDYTLKSNRARAVGKSLAPFLSQFSNRRIVLAGYSLGCQALLIALEDLSNGSCTPVANAAETRQDQYRVCLIAPALEPCYVSQHRCPLAGAELVAQTDIFDNSADRALKCAKVLGWRVAPGGGTPIQVLAWQGRLPIANITMFDLACSVGKKHSVVTYTAVPIVGVRLREMVAEIATGRE